MLVLSRKKNETIIIDGRIKVEVLKIKGNTIRLGISAPSDIKVLRGELAPFQIDVDLDNKATGERDVIADEQTDYSRNVSTFTIDADDLSRLANPFAVVAG